MNNRKLEISSISKLKVRDGNPRTHSKKQIRQIANSISQFGFNNPILIDQSDTIVAGQGRLEAARLLDFKTVPTIRLEELSEDEIRAYVIADNKLADNAGWDSELLAIELQGLLDIDLDFDITFTGFEIGEIDVILDGSIEDSPSGESSGEDDTPVLSTGSAITQPGDLWQLGSHRLFCGDATSAGSYKKLLNGARAALIFTDPPYNVPIDGHVTGLGKTQHREFAMASGEMSSSEFRSFLEEVFDLMAANSSDGSIHFIFMDWRHMAEVLAAGDSIYGKPKNLCVWAKTNGGMGTFYRSRHELIFVFKSGTSAHINNFELGQNGRYRTNVWEYAGVNSFGQDRDDALAMHPTVKPVELIADAIKDCSKRKQIVLDPFGGSGSTLIAAEKTGRHAYLIELDPLYCDTIIRRWQEFTGEVAMHSEIKKPYEDIGELRMNTHASYQASE